MVRPLLLFALALGLAACSQPESAASASSVSDDVFDLTASTPEQVLRNVIEHQASPDVPRVLLYDADVFDFEHGDEIVSTLEIVDVDTLTARGSTFAYVFARYTVGTRVFRTGLKLRQLESDDGPVWAATNEREIYFSDYDTSWQEKPDGPLDKRLADWEEETAKRFSDVVEPAPDIDDIVTPIN